ncbi:MAG: hypothetical protein QOF73_5420 [Thermomicrobiales bacterium]|nr:hypothetical protein [Thermomicrobiales bacterium]
MTLSATTAALDTPMENGRGTSPHTTAPEFVEKADTTKSPVGARELLRSDAGDVSATTVSMDRSGAESIRAERVTMDHSGAKTLEAKSAQLVYSGVMLLKTERAVMQGGSAVVVSASEARLVKSRVLAVIADRQTAEGELKTLVHVGSSDGCIRPVFDGKGALGFGAGVGLVVLVFGRLLGRLVGRR